MSALFSKINKQNIFLIDGVGAMVTAALLFFLLGSFPSFFGVPNYLLVVLSGIAFTFAVYSLTCHLLLRSERLKRNREALRIIALMNIGYCILTIVSMIELRSTISVWGMLYFIGEIMLILVIAFTDIRLAK
ncbi:hypothetical protein N9Y60_03055 [Crocinitomicaceae bacterium]|nr:hypothetical protein [Crocinitomicaceae bacterium]